MNRAEEIKNRKEALVYARQAITLCGGQPQLTACLAVLENYIGALEKGKVGKARKEDLRQASYLAFVMARSAKLVRDGWAAKAVAHATSLPNQAGENMYFNPDFLDKDEFYSWENFAEETRLTMESLKLIIERGAPYSPKFWEYLKEKIRKDAETKPPKL